MNALARWIERASRPDFKERAMNVGNVGSVLMQTMINRTVQDISLRKLGLGTVLTREPGSGDAAYENQRTPGADPAFVSDTTDLTASEATGTYAQKRFPFKTLATNGKVTRRAQAQGRSYGQLLSREIVQRTVDFADSFERALVTGDATAQPLEFDGLLTLVGAVSGQTVAQTANPLGDIFTLDMLDEAIDTVKDSDNGNCAIFASLKGRRMINAALQAQQQFDSSTVINGGFRVRTYDGIPIVPSTRIPNVLTWNGTNISAFTGGNTTAILVVNLDYVSIEELTPATVLPLAKRSSQFDEFDIYWDGVLNFKNSKGAAVLGGLRVNP